MGTSRGALVPLHSLPALDVADHVRLGVGHHRPLVCFATGSSVSVKINPSRQAIKLGVRPDIKTLHKPDGPLRGTQHRPCPAWTGAVFARSISPPARAHASGPPAHPVPTANRGGRVPEAPGRATWGDTSWRGPAG